MVSIGDLKSILKFSYCMSGKSLFVRQPSGKTQCRIAESHLVHPSVEYAEVFVLPISESRVGRVGKIQIESTILYSNKSDRACLLPRILNDQQLLK